MNYTNLLTNIAKKSPVPQFKHASIITKGGAILAADYNGNDFHAEIGAMKKLWPNKIKGTTMINIRITKLGIGISKPCPSCHKVMKAMGVKTVIYTDRNGKFVKERV